MTLYILVIKNFMIPYISFQKFMTPSIFETQPPSEEKEEMGKKVELTRTKCSPPESQSPDQCQGAFVFLRCCAILWH